MYFIQKHKFLRCAKLMMFYQMQPRASTKAAARGLWPVDLTWKTT
jgi:hypothetical protein